MNREKVYKHIEDFMSLARSLRMKSEEWRVLFAIDGKRSLFEIRDHLQLDDALIEAAVLRFLNYGIITEQEIGLDEFIERYQAEIVEDPYSRNIVQAYSQQQRHGFKLKRVIEFIEGHSVSGDTRGFNVYRVFMKIPPPVLRGAGISSLKEIDPALVVDDKEFKDALCESVKNTLGKDLPETLFASS